MDSKEQEALQKHLVQFLIKDVFNTITEDDILIEKAVGKWLWKGRELTPEMIVGLRNEAKNFQGGLLWQILKSELLWKAQVSGIVESKTEADQISSKVLIYLTRVIDTKLKKMLE